MDNKQTLRIEILQEEIKYFETLIEPHDCGFIHTTISFLKDRIENLKGNKDGWPFKK